MATGNFYKVEASKHFAVLMSYEDEETGEMICPDEHELEWLKEDLVEMFKDTGIREDAFRNVRDDLRSFPGSGIASGRYCKSFGDAEVAIHIYIVIRSAYYDGATLDYYFNFEVNDNYDLLPDSLVVKEDLEWIWDFNPGMATIQSKNILTWFRGEEAHYRELIENIFEKISTPLGVTAQFSNGETMYSKA